MPKNPPAQPAQTPDAVSSSHPRQDPQAVIRVLRSWCEDDPDEQRETWEFLRRALDEDRLSDRKLFP